MSFQQDLKLKPIRDFVFPVGNIVDTRFLLKGTAFFVGNTGVAITAAHVVDQLLTDDDNNPYQEPNLVGLFVDNSSRFQPIDILRYEKHQTEDVAVLQLKGNFESIFQITQTSEYASRDYSLWGYPEKIAHEVRAHATNADEAAHLIRPDLIYSKGYIRRRVTHGLSSSIYLGTSFYELSAVAGGCCSGSPIYIYPHTPHAPFKVFGIYIGEETAGQPPVGYATRTDAIAGWTPQIVGQPLSQLPALG